MTIKHENIIQDPLVSVIICTYNQENYIRQCIESILSQETEYTFEIIIGEDCGTDGTKDICIEYQQKHPERISLILNENNLGVVQNWINCINKSRGKYIMQCAGDDFWHNVEKIQLQVKFMEVTPSCGVLHTDFNELDINSQQIISSFIKTNNILIPEGFIQKEIFQGLVKICAPTLCFRKEQIDKHVDFSNFILYKFPIEDWPTLIILSKYSEIRYLNNSTVTYRKGHESISNPLKYTKTIDRFNHEKIMYKYLCNLFPNDLEYNEQVYDLYVNKVLLSLAYKRNEFSKAKEFSRKMIELGDKAFRTKLSTSWIGFKLFRAIKKMK